MKSIPHPPPYPPRARGLPAAGSLADGRGIKAAIQGALRRLGYELRRTTGGADGFDGSYVPYSAALPHREIVDLEAIANISRSIPGMVTPRSAQILYTLCYMQEVAGDVVEIGSWQGRSSAALARAVRNSGNGRFYAVDHFHGNVGKEDRYVVGRQDLSDLKDGFLTNMAKCGLSFDVTLLDMSSAEARRELDGHAIRFLFIDGDHIQAGVERDVGLFLPMLVEGGVVVFDDFSPAFPGVLAAVDVLMSSTPFSRVMSYSNTLVLKR